nr:protein kinase [Kofleriaceae bacterium]
MSDSTATERVGRYQLLEPIGGGPTGVVSRAKVFGVAGFERQFAIKRFLPEVATTGPAAQALSAAARAYGGLEHPRIARMTEFGVSQGTTFTAVEYVAGIDALRLATEARLAGATLPAGGALALVSQAARAIGYAHGRGISHLGLAPTNVIVTADGDVKITDFAVLAATLPAKPVDSPRLAQRIAYLAPEQIAGEATSAATDVFALGVLAYELVTGERAFRGDSVGQIAAAVVAGAPAELPVPRPIVRVLQRCLARSPFERFPDARALADALDAALRVAPVPGSRKDVGVLVKELLDRLATLREGQMSGMLSIDLGTGPRPRVVLDDVIEAGAPEPDGSETDSFVRPDTEVPGPVPLSGLTQPDLPRPMTTMTGLAPPPIPVPQGIALPPAIPAIPAPALNATLPGVRPGAVTGGAPLMTPPPGALPPPVPVGPSRGTSPGVQRPQPPAGSSGSSPGAVAGGRAAGASPSTMQIPTIAPVPPRPPPPPPRPQTGPSAVVSPPPVPPPRAATGPRPITAPDSGPMSSRTATRLSAGVAVPRSPSPSSPPMPLVEAIVPSAPGAGMSEAATPGAPDDGPGAFGIPSTPLAAPPLDDVPTFRQTPRAAREGAAPSLFAPTAISDQVIADAHSELDRAGTLADDGLPRPGSEPRDLPTADMPPLLVERLKEAVRGPSGEIAAAAEAAQYEARLPIGHVGDQDTTNPFEEPTVPRLDPPLDSPLGLREPEPMRLDTEQALGAEPLLEAPPASPRQSGQILSVDSPAAQDVFQRRRQTPMPLPAVRAPQPSPITPLPRSGMSIGAIVALLGVVAIAGGAIAAWQLGVFGSGDGESAPGDDSGSAKVATAKADAGATSTRPPSARDAGALATAPADAGSAVAALADARAGSNAASNAVGSNAVARVGSNAAASIGSNAVASVGSGSPVPAGSNAAPPPIADAQPTSSSGDLVVHSTPTGAHVYLDGADKGVTPATIPALAGRHDLTLYALGFDLYQGKIDGHGTFDLTLTAAPATTGDGGIKVIHCKELNRYYVYVDGKPAGQTCPTDNRVNAVLGPHTVDLLDIQTGTKRTWHIQVTDLRLSYRVRVDEQPPN